AYLRCISTTWGKFSLHGPQVVDHASTIVYLTLLFTSRSCNCFHVSRWSLTSSPAELSSERAARSKLTMASTAAMIAPARSVVLCLIVRTLEKIENAWSRSEKLNSNRDWYSKAGVAQRPSENKPLPKWKRERLIQRYEIYSMRRSSVKEWRA